MPNSQRMDNNLQNLFAGNKRYAASNLTHPRQGTKRRKEVSKGQKPFAVIVGCSDSRIPPEIIFDQGLGDLFVIRVAGNIVDNIALGSIEYAIDHLGAKLIVVLGHGGCGAVTAAATGSAPRGHIGSIIKAIAPAVKKVKGERGDLIENAIRANVNRVAHQIKSSKPILARSVRDGKLDVVGTYYNINTGVVELVA